MPTPTLSVITDSSATHNVGIIWLNPENPVTIDSSSGMTPVLTVNRATLPAGISPNPLNLKYRLTNVWSSIDRNYDGVNNNENHSMKIMLQSSDNGVDWTNFSENGINSINNATGRLRLSTPGPVQQYVQVSARVFPYRDGTNTQATVLMGLDGNIIPNPAN